MAGPVLAYALRRRAVVPVPRCGKKPPPPGCLPARDTRPVPPPPVPAGEARRSRAHAACTANATACRGPDVRLRTGPSGWCRARRSRSPAAPAATALADGGTASGPGTGAVPAAPVAPSGRPVPRAAPPAERGMALPRGARRVAPPPPVLGCTVGGAKQADVRQPAQDRGRADGLVVRVREDEQHPRGRAAAAQPAQQRRATEVHSRAVHHPGAVKTAAVQGRPGRAAFRGGGGPTPHPCPACDSAGCSAASSPRADPAAVRGTPVA